jgi:allophanate hydrolase
MTEPLPTSEATPAPARARARTAPPTVEQRVRAAYRRIEETGRPEIWITLRPVDEALAEARRIETRAGERPESMPLRGLLVAVKDNIDVAGLPTTAGCPAYAYTPEASAPAVRRLTEAGALVLGKTNMDQFATGLVGTRSPYGAVRAAGDPAKISGGSSSGSAVAVALSLVDIGLGTDTAGSGRVPAAFNGIVGIKPTLGLIPATGVVPAARPYDTVTAFARDLATAQRAIAAMTGPDAGDPRCRVWPPDVRLAVSGRPHIAIPAASALAPLSTQARCAFDAAVHRLAAAGARTEVIDVAPLLEAARLLYDGALVAERYAAVGEFLTRRRARDDGQDGPGIPDGPDGPGMPDGLDPTVTAIISAAGRLPAHLLAADLERLDHYRAAARSALAGFEALLLPTTTEHPTIDAVRRDPVGVNSRLGTYTNFVNLLDLAAVAVPAGEADGSPFGVSVITRAFEDQVALDIAALLTGEPAPAPVAAPGRELGVDLAVFGAHMLGQPLNHQLIALGARYIGPLITAPAYRLTALPGRPRPARRRHPWRALDPFPRRPRFLPRRPARADAAGQGGTGGRRLDHRFPRRSVRHRPRHRHHPPRQLARLPRHHPLT